MNILADIKSMCIGENVNSVSATELHKILGVKSKISTWLPRRIEKYKFQENFDFIKVVVDKDTAGRPTYEYYITLDMAKELSMVENNEKGREARKYFIEVEKEHRENLSLTYQGKNFDAIVRGYKSQLVQHNKKIELLEKNLNELIAENATLALPAPAVDVEPYKKHIAQLQEDLNKKESLREHFEFQSACLLGKVREYKKAPTTIKSMLGKFLDFPDVYVELEQIILRLERVK